MIALKNRIEKHRTFIERKKGYMDSLHNQIENAKEQKEELNVSLQDHEEALTIIKQVGQKTQEKLQYHISDITSLAMEAVLDTPYKLSVQFVERRNKMECDLLFEDPDGQYVDPLTAAGGGVVDIASFALRNASWSMQTPKTRPTIILDEPLRFLDKSKHEKASEMIKQLSEKLGIQFIIITHEEKLTEAADRVFNVIKKGKVSKVKQV